MRGRGQILGGACKELVIVRIHQPVVRRDKSGRIPTGSPIRNRHGWELWPLAASVAY